MKQPNVLLVCVDHWPGRYLGVAGHPVVSTPTLDMLASSGVRFTNAYSATPTCIPARRALMTGTEAKVHGDRVFDQKLPMPDLPTLAQCFSQAGYQTYAVGKLHVYPQRDRIGFDDVILNEEGRHHLGMGADDYELYLAQQGYPGQEFTHGCCTNMYMVRPWHLPEHCHPTNWSSYQMCQTIKRRDPTRPALWYLSYNCPHPPLVPPQAYLDLYANVDIEEPFIGEWAKCFDKLPRALKKIHDQYPQLSKLEMQWARRAFYAACTHIDHQLRLVIGMLREEELLDNTIIMFTSDHGEQLGNHGLFEKTYSYEDSAKIPMILVPSADYSRVGHHRTDNRLVELRDVMPTLLDLAGIDIPETVSGISMATDASRDCLYMEHYEDEGATRAIRDSRYKFIWYPTGNHTQLFDLETDPHELHNLTQSPDHQDIRKRLTAKLIENLWGIDLEWVEGDRLVGTEDTPFEPQPNRGLNGQRGWRFM